MHVSQLFVYPVKGVRGNAVAEVEIEPRGPVGDRRWMLVDGEGVFLTQRRFPRLALVQAACRDGGLRLEAPGQSPLDVPTPDASGVRRCVRIWRDEVPALEAGPAAHAWFSRFLGQDVHLVYMDQGARRPVDPVYGQPTDEVSFADGYPLLLTAEASLADLNARLPAPVTMRRFRPNVVVAGSAAFAEDTWREIRVGEVVFRVVKPCARCAVTTVDPETAEVGQEPLRTLAQFRRRDGQVFFGQNLIPATAGVIHVGDRLTIL